jgi:hypothetical protein
MIMELSDFGKPVVITPLYLSFVWILMISYQLFTQTAVTTVVGLVDWFWPTISGWLMSQLDIIVFVFAFTWAFVLSSVIPSVILGSNRSVLIQFLVVLTLTFIPFVLQKGVLVIFEGKTVAQILNLAPTFTNPAFALGYLFAPYGLMLALDLRARKTRSKKAASSWVVFKAY